MVPHETTSLFQEREGTCPESAKIDPKQRYVIQGSYGVRLAPGVTKQTQAEISAKIRNTETSGERHSSTVVDPTLNLLSMKILYARPCPRKKDLSLDGSH